MLTDVTWDCKKGERVGLVGWNGAGKTTQLKIIMGEIEQDEARLLANNVKIGYLSKSLKSKIQHGKGGIFSLVRGRIRSFKKSRTRTKSVRGQPGRGIDATVGG